MCFALCLLAFHLAVLSLCVTVTVLRFSLWASLVVPLCARSPQRQSSRVVAHSATWHLSHTEIAQFHGRRSGRVGDGDTVRGILATAAAAGASASVVSASAALASAPHGCALPAWIATQTRHSHAAQPDRSMDAAGVDDSTRQLLRASATATSGRRRIHACRTAVSRAASSAQTLPLAVWSARRSSGRRILPCALRRPQRARCAVPYCQRFCSSGCTQFERWGVCEFELAAVLTGAAASLRLLASTVTLFDFRSAHAVCLWWHLRCFSYSSHARRYGEPSRLASRLARPVSCGVRGRSRTVPRCRSGL